MTVRFLDPFKCLSAQSLVLSEPGESAVASWNFPERPPPCPRKHQRWGCNFCVRDAQILLMTVAEWRAGGGFP